MLLTKEDAENVICGQLKLFAAQQAVALGRSLAPNEITKAKMSKAGEQLREMVNCDTTECMYWRWDLPNAEEDTDLGYCGQAGKPH